MNRQFSFVLRGTLLCASLVVAGLTGCQAAKPAADDWFEGGEMRTASPETMQLTARILASKGKTTQAGFILDRMAREYPNEVGTYTEGAEVLMIEGRIADAIAWIDRGLERLPGNAILLNNRGMCHLVAGRLGPATKDFEAAFAADSSDADFVGNLALVRGLAGDEDEARSLWSRVLPAREVEANLQLARSVRNRFSMASES